MVVPLEMGWRHLLFENWPVEPDVMDARLPDPLEPDTFDGSAWLTVLPFTNVAVRPRGVPEPFGVRVPELNVRTYVTLDGVPSIYFFGLDAGGLAGPATVVGARLFHHLPYYLARSSLETAGEEVRFGSRRCHPGARPARYEATYRPAGEPFRAPDRARSEFLTERRRFYTQDQRAAIRYTDVDHPAWTLYPAEVDVEANTLFSAYGFAEPDADPVYYYSPGLDVATSTSRRLR